MKFDPTSTLQNTTAAQVMPSIASFTVTGVALRWQFGPVGPIALE